MNRRNLFRVLSKGHKNLTFELKKTSILSSTLQPYQGTWGYHQAAHLLRRTTFGPTDAQIKSVVKMGISATIDKLFEENPLPPPPVYYDSVVSVGKTWVHDSKSTSVNAAVKTARVKSLWGWSFLLMKNAGLNIREKMTLFWHNHFVVANTPPRMTYQYITTLRKNALGNFKTLVRKITVDPAMLVYLNGTQNSRKAPNENYARELLELFTTGQRASRIKNESGRYSEHDIFEIARSLTGWVIFDKDDSTEIQSSFWKDRHDKGRKKISKGFGRKVIRNEDAYEYKVVIDHIFKNEEVPKHICRKLYRWFVHSDITLSTEEQIINPMAQLLVANNFDIQPVLKTLLSSEHFYDEKVRGGMIAHPIDFLFKIVNTCEIDFSKDFIRQYRIMVRLYKELVPMEMNLFNHPSVAGWRPFYQAPQYDRLWINAATLSIRSRLSDLLLIGMDDEGKRVRIDTLAIVNQLNNPSDIDGVIKQLGEIFFVYPPSDNQIFILKDIMVSDTPGFDWKTEFNKYKTGDVKSEFKLERKLRTLFRRMFKMPEFYVI